MKANQNKAKKTDQALKKPIQKSKHKIRTSLRFTRSRLRLTKSIPSYPRSLKSLEKKESNVSPNKILLQPISSDKNMTKMENENTITFYVNPKANKASIKQAFKKLYNSKVRAVNTLHTSKGKKKAYIRLDGESEACNIASKIGIL